MFIKIFRRIKCLLFYHEWTKWKCFHKEVVHKGTVVANIQIRERECVICKVKEWL